MLESAVLLVASTKTRFNPSFLASCARQRLGAACDGPDEIAVTVGIEISHLAWCPRGRRASGRGLFLLDGLIIVTGSPARLVTGFLAAEIVVVFNYADERGGSRVRLRVRAARLESNPPDYPVERRTRGGQAVASRSELPLSQNEGDRRHHRRGCHAIRPLQREGRCDGSRSGGSPRRTSWLHEATGMAFVIRRRPSRRSRSGAPTRRDANDCVRARIDLVHLVVEVVHDPDGLGVRIHQGAAGADRRSSSSGSVVPRSTRRRPPREWVGDPDGASRNGEVVEGAAARKSCG